jgi:hypothetical protein
MFRRSIPDGERFFKRLMVVPGLSNSPKGDEKEEVFL